MGILTDIRAAWAQPAASDDGHWTSRGTNGPVVASSAGVLITEDEVMKNPVANDCVWILKDAVGQVETILYDRTGLNGKERERADTALSYRLRQQPNDDQTAIEFKRQMQQSACFFEFAYAEIEWRGAEPVNIWPRHPSRIRAAKVTAGRKRYEYLEDDQRTWRPILSEDMLRVPGRPVLRYSAETLGHAIALERYSARLFGKSPKPSVAIKAEKGVVYDDKQKAEIKRQLMANGGDGAGMPYWVPEGLDIAPYGMTNQQAEFGSIRTALVGDIARYWRIPPYMIGLLESGTVSYASVNTQSVDFVVYCLMPWLVGWEQAMQRDLVVDKRGQFIEFLTAALLRGTTKERYEVYQVAINTGVMSVNEVRRLENLNPRQGGDVYLTPMNMSPAAMARHTEPGSPADRLLQSFAQDAAGRVVRREQGALAKVAERAGPDAAAWEAGVRDFYAAHPAFVAEALKLPQGEAIAWAESQMWSVLAEGPEAVAAWGRTQSDQLAAMALERAIPVAAAPAIADLRAEVVALRTRGGQAPAQVSVTAPVQLDSVVLSDAAADNIAGRLERKVEGAALAIADQVRETGATLAADAAEASRALHDNLAAVEAALAATVTAATARRPETRDVFRDERGLVRSMVREQDGRRWRVVVDYDANDRIIGTREEPIGEEP